MKTDDLIAALARDAKLTGPSAARRLALALLVGGVSAALLLVFAILPRPDLAAALSTRPFVLKMVTLATLALAAIALLKAAARPEGRWPRAVLIVPLALLAYGFGHEIATQLPATYGARLVGENWAFCLVAIPLMAAIPLVAIIRSLRYAAPQDPTRAGLAAGFAAGALAAFFYGVHCTDDSPLFVATWYTLALALVTFTGGAIGRRTLAW